MLRRTAMPGALAALLVLTVLAVLMAAGCSEQSPSENTSEKQAPPEPAAQAPSADQARATAEQAYVFAYPMLENYRTILALLRAKGTSFYIGAFNTFAHDTRLLGPEVKQIVRPNNDTLYSKAVLDLRAEPMVLRVPAVPDRYYSFQLIDLYTHNIGYVGTRATGSEAGSYLVAGPAWSGQAPSGIDGVIRSEGTLVVVLGRTAVRDAADVAAVKEIQAGYQLTPLSVFLGEPSPPAPPDYDFPAFDPKRADSPDFLDTLAFLMGQLKVDPSEKDMVAGFLRLRDSLDEPGVRAAVQQGIDAARQKIEQATHALGQQRNGWSLITGLFGDRKEMQGKYLTRAAAAMFGLWGNDEEEAYYQTASLDANGEPLDGSKHRYELYFPAEDLPDVAGFWSITMYQLPSQLMVANPIHRYSIGDRTEGVAYGEDGSLTLYIQAKSPGADERSNWLPAPSGPFSLTLRMYVPSKTALEGPYAPPPVRPVE